MKDCIEPIWNAENMNRKQGDTTFKTCGWCEFVGCGSCRYSCHLESDCDLMKDYGEERKVRWDTPCKILFLGVIDIKAIVQSKQYDLESLKKQIESKKREIAILLKDKRIIRREKPALPDSRGADYFKLKSVVWVFIEKDCKWVRGIVVNGYRSGDGCVSYVLDDYPDSAKGWGCGMSVPCVLLDWEYQYFKKHIEEYHNYLTMCDRVYNGDRLNLKVYIKAMKG